MKMIKLESILNEIGDLKNVRGFKWKKLPKHSDTYEYEIFSPKYSYTSRFWFGGNEGDGMYLWKFDVNESVPGQEDSEMAITNDNIQAMMKTLFEILQDFVKTYNWNILKMDQADLVIRIESFKGKWHDLKRFRIYKRYIEMNEWINTYFNEYSDDGDGNIELTKYYHSAMNESQINEIGDLKNIKPFKWKRSSRVGVYTATSDKETYHIGFMEKDPIDNTADVFNLIFGSTVDGITNASKLTNDNIYRMFATLKEVIEDFINEVSKYNSNRSYVYVEIDPVKGDEIDNAGTKRFDIYRKYLFSNPWAKSYFDKIKYINKDKIILIKKKPIR